MLNAAALVDKAKRQFEETWKNYAWANMRAAFRKPTTWQKLRADEASSFERLMAHCDDPQRTDMLGALAFKLATMAEVATDQPDYVRNLADLCLVASKASNGIGLPIINIPASLSIFLNVVAACAGDEALLDVLKSKATEAEMATELSANLADPPIAPFVEAKMRALLRHKPALPWDGFIDAAGQVIQDREVSFAGFEPSVACLGILQKSERRAGAKIKELSDSNVLMQKLHQSHEQRRLGVEATLLAMLLMTRPAFDPPRGQTWDVLLQDRPELVAFTDEALKEFGAPDDLELLVEQGVSNASAAALIRGLVSLRVENERMGLLSIDKIIADVSQYLKYIETNMQPKFLRDFSEYETFWEEIEKASLNSSTVAILNELIKSGSGSENEARAALEKKLRLVTKDEWVAAITNGGDPMPAASALHEITAHTFRLGGTFSDALEAMIAHLLSNSDATFRTRWFESLTLVSQSSRVTLLKDIRGRIVLGTEVSDLATLLRTGGDVLLTEGDFTGEADGAVRKIVLPLLASTDGMTWLRQSATVVHNWLTKSSNDTRNVVEERLAEMHGAADEAAKLLLDQLATEWSFDIEARVANARDEGKTTSS